MADLTQQQRTHRDPPPAVARTGVSAAFESPLVKRREIAGAGQHLFQLFGPELLRHAQKRKGASHEA